MHEDLFRTVQEATEGAYDVVGELGHDDARVAYLARELDSGLLAVLLLGFGADEIEVVQRLGPGVPVSGSLCLSCGSPKEGWEDRCARCETRGYGAAAVTPEGSPDALLRSVRSAAAGSYDVLGALERVGGAPVYFAREVATGRLVGLALQQDPAEEEGFALVLAWEGPRTGDAASASPAYASTPSYVSTPADPDSSWASADPEEITDPLGRTPAPPPAYTAPAYVPAELAPAPAPRPPQRRRVGLLTGAAVGAVALVGLTLFALQGTGADAPPRPEEPVATTPPPVVPADTTPVVPVVPADTVPARPEPRREPRETEREKSNQMARVVIDGSLPGGWTRSVNGRGSSSNPVVEVRPRRASTIAVDAPGYCTESRTFQLSPGEEYRWVLSLRERPLVGEC